MENEELPQTVSVSINKEDLHDPVTLERYDSVSNFPISLPCGHNLSVNTYNQIKTNDYYPKCPICRKEFSALQGLPKDVFFISIIRQVEKTKNLSCHAHPQESAKFFCLDERVIFCDDCACDGSHEGHKKKPIKSILNNFEQKIKGLEEYNSKIEELIKTKNQAINETIGSLVAEFNQRLHELFYSQDIDKALIEKKEVNKILIHKIHDINIGKKDINFEEIIGLAEKQLTTEKEIKDMKICEEIEKIKFSISSMMGQELKKLTKEVIPEVKPQPSLISTEIIDKETIIKDDYDIIKYLCPEMGSRLSSLKIDGSKLTSIEILSISLKRLFNLTSLELGFPDVQAINDKFVENCSTSIQTLKNLTTLKMDFSSCKLVTDTGLVFMASSLEQVKNLKTFSFDIWGCSQISDSGLKIFLSCLMSFEALTALHLGFGESSTITDQSSHSLSTALKSLRNLTYLSLSIYTCDQITDNYIEVLALPIEQLVQMASLELNFDQCKNIGNLTLQRISASIKKLPLLVKLLLSFNECRIIDDEGMDSLNESLKFMGQLTEIALNFWSCGISDKGLEGVSEALNHLELLHSLEVNFDDCLAVTDKGILAFSTAVEKLKKLTNLSIRCWSLTIDDETIGELGLAISKLELLNTLYLNFNECNFISDIGMDRLAKHIQKIKTLTSLDLNIWKCTSITETGRDCLTKLKEIPTITTFKLECKEMDSYSLF
jgi:hypothetical protein